MSFHSTMEIVIFCKCVVSEAWSIHVNFNQCKFNATNLIIRSRIRSENSIDDNWLPRNDWNQWVLAKKINGSSEFQVLTAVIVCHKVSTIITLRLFLPILIDQIIFGTWCIINVVIVCIVNDVLYHAAVTTFSISG